MLIKKSEQVPLYDESILTRGYDNVEYVERLRHTCRGNKRF